MTPAAIEARKRSNVKGVMTGPYRNVIRMHVLIFFFILAHVAGLRSAAVYAVVYAAYFFPWRLLPARSTRGIASLRLMVTRSGGRARSTTLLSPLLRASA